MVSRKETTNELTRISAKYWTKKRYCVSREIGLRSRKLGMLRADLLCVNFKFEFIIIEIKSCPADFYSDSKLLDYLPYCNRLYLSVNQQTYDKIKPDIPDGIGVIICDSKAKVKKRCVSRKISDKVKADLSIRLIFRNADFNRYKKVKARI